jgi:thiamine-monophosphate kinase
MFSENSIIASLKKEFPKYIGDDAAVIEKTGEQSYVVAKDILIEDVHFRTSYFDPLSLAHKALHANLSDIAAMGSEPKFLLLGISIPVSQEKYIEEFLLHFASLCKEALVILIGGDTTRSTDKIFISITVIGTALTKDIKRRNTAKPGDLICVAGDIGEAYLGFIACEKSLKGFEDYKKKFLRPEAKLKEGMWFAYQPSVTSMMDISDGLDVDVKNLCKASHLRARIELDLLMPDSMFRSSCTSLKIDPEEAILSGGEDYSLLFTVNPASYESLAKDFLDKFGYKIKHIGFVEKGEDVYYSANGKPKFPNLKPFSHLGESL